MRKRHLAMMFDWHRDSIGWFYQRTDYAHYIALGRLVIAIRHHKKGAA